MSVHIERRHVPYSRQQMFDLVADVESYPDFVPHMLASRIAHRISNTVDVDMMLGVGPLRRSIRSTGILSPPRQIEITSHDSLMRRFNLRWTFGSTKEAGTLIELRADFELRSRWLQHFLAPYFKGEVAALVDAFERRAEKFYNRTDGKEPGFPISHTHSAKD